MFEQERWTHQAPYNNAQQNQIIYNKLKSIKMKYYHSGRPEKCYLSTLYWDKAWIIAISKALVVEQEDIEYGLGLVLTI